MEIARVRLLQETYKLDQGLWYEELFYTQKKIIFV